MQEAVNDSGEDRLMIMILPVRDRSVEDGVIPMW